MAGTPILRATRVVFTLDLLFSLVAGVVLVGLASRTEDAFAWTIKLPVTAAFLGAGYLAAVAMLIPSYRQRLWRPVRIIPVMGVTLTFVTAVVTLRHLDDFHLGAGSTTGRLAAWAWLAVYVTIPLLLAAVFVAQERAGGRREREVVEPLLPLMRVVLSAQALAAGVLGLGLVAAPGTFDAVWPWPLPPLSAGAVGAWLLTVAAGSAWGLLDGDWRAFRIALPGLGTYGVFVTLAVALHAEPLDGGDRQERVFAVGLLALVALALPATIAQERRRGYLAAAPATAADGPPLESRG